MNEPRASGLGQVRMLRHDAHRVAVEAASVARDCTLESVDSVPARAGGNRHGSLFPVLKFPLGIDRSMVNLYQDLFGIEPRQVQLGFHFELRADIVAVLALACVVDLADLDLRPALAGLCP